jgi:hypothetical protein
VVPPVKIGKIESLRGPEPPAIEHTVKLSEVEIQEKDRSAKAVLLRPIPDMTNVALVDAAFHRNALSSRGEIFLP